MKKNNKGITMVSLTITIIVLIILSGVGIKVGTNNATKAKNNKWYSELLVVQHAVYEQYTKYNTTNDTTYLLGNKLDLSEAEEIAEDMNVTLITIPSSYKNSDYYILDKASLKEMGITNTNDEYMINYVSGEVLNITQKATSDGTPLYAIANTFSN